MGFIPMQQRDHTGFCPTAFVGRRIQAALLRKRTFVSSAEAALVGVLASGILDGLPLHVAGVIRTCVAQGVDVVNDVARTGAATLAGAGAGVLTFERQDGGGATGLVGRVADTRRA